MNKKVHSGVSAESLSVHFRDKKQQMQGERARLLSLFIISYTHSPISVISFQSWFWFCDKKVTSRELCVKASIRSSLFPESKSMPKLFSIHVSLHTVYHAAHTQVLARCVYTIQRELNELITHYANDIPGWRIKTSGYLTLNCKTLKLK